MIARPLIRALLSAVLSSPSLTGWLKSRLLAAAPDDAAAEPVAARSECTAGEIGPAIDDLPEADPRELADDAADALRQDNQRLRRELRVLAREAEKNETIFRRFHRLELSLLNASSLTSLLDRMTRGTQDILVLDEVSLFLHDPEREVATLLIRGAPAGQVSPRVVLVDQVSVCSPDGSPLNQPWLGPFRQEHSSLFRAPEGLRSVALLPLLSQGYLFGGLNLASAEPGRYTRSHAYDFHSRLAAVSSLCLQNAINRERLVITSHTDLLTLWYNRRYLETRLPEELARAVRYAEPLSCLLFDIDHFKRINDKYGHLAGDDVLREMAGRIKKELRVSDLAVRYGGEEFVVFLARTTREAAAVVAERICSCVSGAPFRLDNRHSLTVTVSVGIADLPPKASARDPRAEGKALLRKADSALYQAKAEGRNRVVLWDDRAG
jgi:diguanylate cyclase (GGDEF)-like protein